MTVRMYRLFLKLNLQGATKLICKYSKSEVVFTNYY
jgi:hypothetical protein